jgi:hypothetical protein
VLASGAYGAHSGGFAFLVQGGIASQKLDLVALGFSESALDTGVPFELGIWIKAPESGLEQTGVQWILVDRLNTTVVSGFLSAIDVAPGKWVLLAETVTEYPPGVRALYFHFGSGAALPQSPPLLFDDAFVCMSP